MIHTNPGSQQHQRVYLQVVTKKIKELTVLLNYLNESVKNMRNSGT